MMKGFKWIAFVEWLQENHYSEEEIRDFTFMIHNDKMLIGKHEGIEWYDDIKILERLETIEIMDMKDLKQFIIV